MKKVVIVLLLTVVVMSSCDPRKQQERDADQRLKHIEQLIAANALNKAKAEIDSIHALYPRLIEKRKMASALKDTIVRRESTRTLAYCDSLIPIRQKEADSLLRNFRFEKEEKYQEFGNFIYKTQFTESNYTRTYLKAYVDENNDFYVVSNYTGGKIEHTSVGVSAGDQSVCTDTLSVANAAFHSFNDGGSYWETLTFKNKEDKGLAAYITQNSNRQLKVTLCGKRKYAYYLADADKKAIAETYRLWGVRKELDQLHKQVNQSALRIVNIKRRNINK